MVIRHLEAPAMTADSIKRLSLREIAVDLVTRFTLGKPPIAIAIITFIVDVPKTAMIIIARTIAGIASSESMNLWIYESVFPPTSPLKIPKRPPAKEATATALMATIREIREP